MPLILLAKRLVLMCPQMTLAQLAMILIMNNLLPLIIKHGDLAIGKPG